MKAARSISIFRDCTMLLFAVLIFIVSASDLTKSASSLTGLGTNSSNSADLATSSRGKRAPGWGKRAPGWGKRAQGWGKRQSLTDDSYEDFHSASDISNTGDLFSSKRYVTDDSFLGGNIDHGRDKRAPGWGKRFSEEDFNTRNMVEMDKKAPGWGKRAPGWGKRAPGWGKRAPGWGKRAQGWGKRSNEIDLEASGAETDADYEARDNEHNTDEDYLEKKDTSQELTNKNAMLRLEEFLSRDVLSTDKRAPGWGKRAQGWGKRDYMTENSKDDLHLGKRAPGWGKRAQGWGKRDYMTENSKNDLHLEKPAPGWEKRAPGWGKRAPGWGKRTTGSGKRAQGWGKRDYEIPIEDKTSSEESDDDYKLGQGWGKRYLTRAKRATSSIAHPSHDVSHELFGSENEFVSRFRKLAEQQSLGAGNKNVVSKPSRK